jgi:hypothetical protein
LPPIRVYNLSVKEPAELIWTRYCPYVLPAHFPQTGGDAAVMAAYTAGRSRET